MLKKIIIVSIVLLPSISFAQQQQFDPIRIISAIENQRNTALSNQAIAEARAGALADEIAKLQARIKELEDTANKSEK